MAILQASLQAIVHDIAIGSCRDLIVLVTKRLLGRNRGALLIDCYWSHVEV